MDMTEFVLSQDPVARPMIVRVEPFQLADAKVPQTPHLQSFLFPHGNYLNT